MKTSIAGLALGLLLAAGAAGAYAWWYHLVALQSAKAAELSTDIAATREAEDRIVAAKAALAELSIDESVLQDYFVSEGNVVAFLADLQELGRKLGSNVSVLSVSAASGAPALSVALQISGTFDAVTRTAGAIEHAPYAITVQSLSLSEGETVKRATVWSAGMTLSVGSAVPPAPTPQGPQPP